MSSQSTKVRIGQLGVGHAHAAGKAQVLKDAPDVDFIGIYEPDPRLVAMRTDHPAYDGVLWMREEELLGDPTVQGVFVETSPAENLRWARRVLEAGKHVLIDKAPGLSLNEFRELLDIAKSRRLHAQIGYNFRFNPAFQFAIEAVRSGMLGNVFNVQAQIPTTLRGYEDRRSEMERYPGGTFYELACHFVDIVVILLGAPQRISSYLRADYHPDGRSPYVDNTVAIYEYDRALAVIQSWAMEIEPMPHRRFEIFGSRGSIRIEPVEPPKLHLCLAEADGQYQSGWQVVHVGDRPRYVGDVAEFVAVITSQRTPLYDFAHDLAVQAAVLQVCGVND